jgi:hypothetical protein
MCVDLAVIQRVNRALNSQEPDRIPIWKSLQNIWGIPGLNREK